MIKFENQNSKIKISSTGFTQVELLITVAIIIILASGVVLAINPLRKFAEARDNRRQNHLNAVWNAVEQKIYDDKGWENCPELPTEDYKPIGRGEGMYDLYSCIYPEYLSKVLVDPKDGSKSGDRLGVEDGYYWSFNDSLASDNKKVEPEAGPIATIRPYSGKFNDGVVAVEESTTNLHDITKGRLTTGNAQGSTPPEIEVVDMDTPWGSEVWKVTFPAGSDTWYDGCRFTSESITVTQGVDYSTSTYIKVAKGDISKLRFYYTGAYGTSSLTKKTNNQGGFNRYESRFNVGTSGDGSANEYFTAYLSESTNKDIVIYVAANQLEEKPFPTSFTNSSRNNGYLRYNEDFKTLHFRFKFIAEDPANIPDWYNLLDIEATNNDNRRLYVELDNNDYIEARIYDHDESSKGISNDISLMPYDTNWHSLTITQTSATAYDIYLDGAFKGTMNDDAEHYYELINLGADFNGGGNINSLINNFAILDYSATEEQIQDWYNFQYNSKYSIWKNPVSNKISLRATNDEIEQVSAGAPSGALSFDGDDDTVHLTDETNQEGESWFADFKPENNYRYTISFWFNAKGVNGGENGLLSRGKGYDSSSGTNWVFYLPNENQVRFRTFGNVSLSLLSNSNDNLLDKWNHVALNFNGEETKLYLNGELHDSSTATGDIRQGGRITMAYYEWPDWHLNGSLDDVRIYDQYLSSEEIKKLYHDEYISTGLVGYWPLNDMEGCKAEDLSGLGNHGVLNPDCPNNNPEWAAGR